MIIFLKLTGIYIYTLVENNSFDDDFTLFVLRFSSLRLDKKIQYFFFKFFIQNDYFFIKYSNKTILFAHTHALFHINI